MKRVSCLLISTLAALGTSGCATVRSPAATDARGSPPASFTCLQSRDRFEHFHSGNRIIRVHRAQTAARPGNVVLDPGACITARQRATFESRQRSRMQSSGMGAEQQASTLEFAPAMPQFATFIPLPTN